MSSNEARAAARSHAEAMDAIYRTQRHIYDLTRKYYLLGRDRLISDLAPPPGGTVLELGCGTARNLIVAARRYPNARFFGFDISEAMLEAARESVRKAGLEGRIFLTRGDATAFSAQHLFGLQGFDRVFCSYTLSMIPGWERAIAAAAGSLAPGGRMHIVDFGTQDDLPRWFARGLQAWLARFQVTPRHDLGSVVHRIAEATRLPIDHCQLYRGYAQYAVIGG
jgi:S-adenosylmethionine-diacylgycerolhomoserine-N-methlytransferase